MTTRHSTVWTCQNDETGEWMVMGDVRQGRTEVVHTGTEDECRRVEQETRQGTETRNDTERRTVTTWTR